MKANNYMEAPIIEGFKPRGASRLLFYPLNEEEVITGLEMAELSSLHIIPQEELERWTGKLSKRALEWYGQTAVAAPPKTAFTFPWNKERHPGHHGGLSEEERFVDVYEL